MSDYKEKLGAVIVDSGHNWQLDEEGEVDIFAFYNDIHNGPICIDCGRSECHHCNPSIWKEKCEK